VISDKQEVRRFEGKGVVEPPPRSAHSSVVYNNEIFIFGGWDGDISKNDFFKYNIGALKKEERKEGEKERNFIFNGVECETSRFIHIVLLFVL
jgi:hypothetical protein